MVIFLVMLVYQRVAIFSFVTFKLQKHLPSTPARPGEAPFSKSDRPPQHSKLSSMISTALQR